MAPGSATAPSPEGTSSGGAALDLARRLIRCKSVTPADDGALAELAAALRPLGFTCEHVVFIEPGTPDVTNLYARWGRGRPLIAFAGHSDVVPPGDPAAWSADPFGGEVRDGVLIGRGAVDMKGALAAFVAAAARVLPGCDPVDAGVALLITGDEEGPSINGTRKLLDWLAARGDSPDLCIVGEPTSGARVGDTVKVGRRGSLNAEITVPGRQGHTAYPQHADNPVHHLVRALHDLIATPLDDGSAAFEPSTLQVTSVDVGNPATNVIPATATAKLNVRFNDRHSGAAVESWLRGRLAATCPQAELALRVSGESFLCPDGPLRVAVAAAVQAVTGAEPVAGTGGGTSDARFIKDVCPVVELGLCNATAHQVDERVPLADLETLTAIYAAALARLLGRPSGPS